MSLRDWTPCEHPGQWPLIGTRVVLEPLDWAAHSAGLYEAVGSPAVADIWDYMPIGPFDNETEFQETFEFVRVKFGWKTLVIRGSNSGKILGMSSYMRIRKDHGSAEIGCVAFGPALKRSAEASEAMYSMARHVFEELGYRRYEWKCHNDNAASRRAATRFGFAFEGVFRNDMVVRGKSRDTAWFAMTDDDWPLIKSAFEAWLSSSNFDAAGQQIRKLGSFRT